MFRWVPQMTSDCLCFKPIFWGLPTKSMLWLPECCLSLCSKVVSSWNDYRKLRNSIVKEVVILNQQGQSNTTLERCYIDLYRIFRKQRHSQTMLHLAHRRDISIPRCLGHVAPWPARHARPAPGRPGPVPLGPRLRRWRGEGHGHGHGHSSDGRSPRRQPRRQPEDQRSSHDDTGGTGRRSSQSGHCWDRLGQLSGLGGYWYQEEWCDCDFAEKSSALYPHVGVLSPWHCESTIYLSASAAVDCQKECHVLRKLCGRRGQREAAGDLQDLRWPGVQSSLWQIGGWNWLPAKWFQYSRRQGKRALHEGNRGCNSI